jgi:hypothetical protein
MLTLLPPPPLTHTRSVLRHLFQLLLHVPARVRCCRLLCHQHHWSLGEASERCELQYHHTNTSTSSTTPITVAIFIPIHPTQCACVPPQHAQTPPPHRTRCTNDQEWGMERVCKRPRRIGSTQCRCWFCVLACQPRQCRMRCCCARERACCSWSALGSSRRHRPSIC